ncbi:hypothetical protein Taro_040382, partial [Colocasia esculenta]|nr:hypothetical protein [Colocasia esculenta]
TSVRYRRSSSLSPSVGMFGSGPNREIPPHFWRHLWESTTTMARGRSSYQNVGSRMTRSRQSRADSRQRIPPIDLDVAVAPASAAGDVPVPAIAVPAIALEVVSTLVQVVSTQSLKYKAERSSSVDTVQVVSTIETAPRTPYGQAGTVVSTQCLKYKAERSSSVDTIQVVSTLETAPRTPYGQAGTVCRH